MGCLWSSGSADRSSSSRAAAGPRCCHPLTHGTSVREATWQLFATAELLNQRQSIGADDALVVDVGHGSHQWAQDHLGVILKEIDLQANKHRGFRQADDWTNNRQWTKKLLRKVTEVLILSAECKWSIQLTSVQGICHGEQSRVSHCLEQK